MSKIDEIAQAVEAGKAKIVPGLVEEALAEGCDPMEILNKGMIDAMGVVGEKFKNNEIFVPEMLVAARAMKKGVEVVKPHLGADNSATIGKMVMGTVAGDLHDIGKNLVVMMLKGAGFEIHDLGTDVDAETFVNKAEEVGANVIGLSALLTTTMPNMKSVVDVLNERGIREKYIVMVGGAPVNESFAEQIGADFYTSDAASAAEVAKKAVLERK